MIMRKVTAVSIALDQPKEEGSPACETEGSLSWSPRGGRVLPTKTAFDYVMLSESRPRIPMGKEV